MADPIKPDPLAPSCDIPKIPGIEPPSDNEFNLPPSPIFSELQLSDVTKGVDTLVGNGIFDELMRASMAHLHREYEAGRITGGVYAEAYMSSMNAVMSAAIQFAVSKVQNENGNILSLAQWELQQQKLLSEKTQIQDKIDGKLVSGSIGKQRQVYDSNIRGFHQKALQDATSAIIQTWTVRTTTGESATAPNKDNKLYDTQIGEAVKRLLCSVDIPLAPDPPTS